MIWYVALQDALWFLVVLGIRSKAPTPFTRKLATVMAVYVVIEFFFHVPMEHVAGRLLW